MATKITGSNRVTLEVRANNQPRSYRTLVVTDVEGKVVHVPLTEEDVDVLRALL